MTSERPSVLGLPLAGSVAVVTGGTGMIGGAFAVALSGAGARVAILGRQRERLESAAATVRRGGGEAVGLIADVCDRDSLLEARSAVDDRWGRIDILVNAAGGNIPKATSGESASLWDVSDAAWREVVDLNLHGTVLPIVVFAERMAEPLAGSVGASPTGSIVNVSSMAAGPVLTRVGGYGAAKAGVENLTRWFAVELARRHGPGIRVNAIAPGFLITEQNRSLLVGTDGAATERGRDIIRHTPADRFGTPRDLLSTLLWLCSPGAEFVSGIVVPVDGGFSAFSGI